MTADPRAPEPESESEPEPEIGVPSAQDTPEALSPYDPDKPAIRSLPASGAWLDDEDPDVLKP